MSAIANVAETNLRHADQAARVAVRVRTVFTRLHQAAVRVNTTGRPRAARPVRVAAQI